MDIFEILREAKNPSKASKPETLNIDDETSTEYVDEAEKNIDDTDDVTETDESETDDIETEEDDTETEDESEEDETTDYTTEVEDISPDMDDDSSEDSSDDSETGDEGSDNNSSDGTSTEQKNNGDIEKDVSLLNSTIKLYFDIKEVIKKLDQLNHIDIVANKIIIQVRTNFSRITDDLYEFITRTYNLNSYVKNLYTYNYFIEAYKVNVEMLKKISIFTINT